MDRMPGACSRPLDFAAVTRHFAGSPTFASFSLFTTTSRATEQLIVSPALAVADDSECPVRMVTWVPAGRVAALNDSESASAEARLRAILRFMSPPENDFDVNGGFVQLWSKTWAQRLQVI